MSLMPNAMNLSVLPMLWQSSGQCNRMKTLSRTVNEKMCDKRVCRFGWLAFYLLDNFVRFVDSRGRGEKHSNTLSVCRKLSCILVFDVLRCVVDDVKNINQIRILQYTDVVKRFCVSFVAVIYP